MNFADRLSVVRSESRDGWSERWSIKLSNGERRKDLHVINFHPIVPKETADAVLALLKQDADLQRVVR